MTNILSQADFARLHGVSRNTVTGWKKDGRLVMATPKLVDVEASNAKLSERSAKSRGGAARGPCGGVASPIAAKPTEALPEPKPNTPRPARPAPAAAPSVAQEDDPEAETPEAEARRLLDAPGRVMLTKAEAETRKENYLALLRELEYAQKSQEVVLVEDALWLLRELLGRVKNKLLSIPSRFAPRLAALRSPEAVNSLLSAEIGLILTELAADFKAPPQPATPPRTEDHDGLQDALVRRAGGTK